MAKTERKWLAHYLDAALPDATSPVYYRIGKDLEEFTTDMSATVDKKQNILGETSVVLSAYEKSGTVEPYYYEKNDALSERLQGIVDNMLVLDDCNSTMVDVHLWEGDPETETSFPAVKWDVVLEVTSYGGDTTGVQIPFNVHYTGDKQLGKFDIATKKFTVDSGTNP